MRMHIYTLVTGEHGVSPAEALPLAKELADWVGEGVDELLTEYLLDQDEEVDDDTPPEEGLSREGYKYL